MRGTQMCTKKSQEKNREELNAHKGETQNPHTRNWKHIRGIPMHAKRSQQHAKEHPNAKTKTHKEAIENT
jgi:hypothetical protein